jgi:hypothetical protein
MASFGDGRRMSKSLPLAPLGLGIEGGRQNEVRVYSPRRVHGNGHRYSRNALDPQGEERDGKTSPASGDRFGHSSMTMRRDH